MKVAVAGLGYVGTVTAVCLVSRGQDLRRADVDVAKVDEIRAGRSSVPDPGPVALVAKAVTSGTFHPAASDSDALDRADVSLACVGIPSAACGDTDGADLPPLAGTLATNAQVISDVVDRVVACDARAVALLGLSLKTNTNHLRESPKVELAERLIGQRLDVRSYDPIVNPARLVGANRGLGW